MLLEDTPQAHDWLRQFDVVDQQVARQLLRRLDLVSQSDFDQRIQALVEGILARSPRENFALFTVSEHPPKTFEENQARRVPGSSADRDRGGWDCYSASTTTLSGHARRATASTGSIWRQRGLTGSRPRNSSSNSLRWSS